ncbi:hypothetical protein BRARA_C02570 [Brassica rapa]|uniref:Uncharacterized protein n=1 Tax=Brassica campestris TaxID=3711 RepID=A0A398A0B5_BRACM|nr:hypothetical protein BRARA_C02570 [Brassica rapa]
MAEALLQPPRTGTPPQESSKIQRLEDRALKLIPVLPSTPKGSVLSSSDKSKNKPMPRSGEIGPASFRNTHQHSSIRLGNLPSNAGGQIKPDTTKKMVVLKPAVKESASPLKSQKVPPPICLPMREATIFQLSGTSALIGTR